MSDKHLQNSLAPLLITLIWLAASLLPTLPAQANPSARTVATTAELNAALRQAEPGDTISLMPGDYVPSRRTIRTHGEPERPITVQAAVPGTARLWSSHVTLFKLYGAHWHFRDLDFQGNSNTKHALHIVRDADDIVLEGNRFQNFHAAIKANGEGQPRAFPDNVRIHRNVFTNDKPRRTKESVVAIDVVGGRNWKITENFISDIGYHPDRRGANTSTAFVKGGAYGATFDRNVVICQWRHTGGYRVGMSLGGGGTGDAYFDRRGMEQCRQNCPEVRSSQMINNIILNCPNSPGIYLNRAQDSLVANNTIYDAYGIVARFPETSARIYNNLMTGRIWARDGSEVESAGNLSSGWVGLGNYIPSVRRRLHAPVPEGEPRFSASIDKFLYWAASRRHDVIDWLGATRLGKGTKAYENWLAAPSFGDLALTEPNKVIAEGSTSLVLDRDYCGQPRTPPGDIGAIEYSAGGCALQEILTNRHGELFTSIGDPRRKQPRTPEPARQLTPVDDQLLTPDRLLRADPEDYREKVAELRPGDRLELAPGNYKHGLDLRGLQLLVRGVRRPNRPNLSRAEAKIP